MVLGDRSEATKSSRKARKQATSLSPGGRSFPHPIHERGQPSNPRQYRSRRACRTGVARVILAVFIVARFRAMELITILNRCYRLRGFVYECARVKSVHKSIKVL